MTIDSVPPSTFASLTLYLPSSSSRLFGRLVICRLRHIHPPREVSWEFDLPRKVFLLVLEYHSPTTTIRESEPSFGARIHRFQVAILTSYVGTVPA
jgi:hypothetical protein